MAEHLGREVIDVAIHLTYENDVENEHYVAHQAVAVDLVHVKEELGAPSCEQFADTQQVNDGVEVVLGPPKRVWIKTVLELFEDYKQLRRDVVQRIEERVHKGRGILVVCG